MVQPNPLIQPEDGKHSEIIVQISSKVCVVTLFTNRGCFKWIEKTLSFVVLYQALYWPLVLHVCWIYCFCADIAMVTSFAHITNKWLLVLCRYCVDSWLWTLYWLLVLHFIMPVGFAQTLNWLQVFCRYCVD